MLDCDCVSVDSPLATTAAWIGIVTFITTTLGLLSVISVMARHVKDADRDRDHFRANLRIVYDQIMLFRDDIERDDRLLPRDEMRGVVMLLDLAQHLVEQMDSELKENRTYRYDSYSATRKWLTRILWIQSSPKLDDMMNKMRHLMPSLFAFQMILLSS
jgi:hypothetical protein